MAEWHLPPDYILDHWTDELLDLMIGKFIKRRTHEAVPPRAKPMQGSDQVVSDAALFASLGSKIQWKKRD